MALPQLTDEQRKQALEKAAAARHARAELREQIKKGEKMCIRDRIRALLAAMAAS